MRNRVLFLSYYYPPHRTSASVRTGAIAKALSESGWSVSVVTVAEELLLNVEQKPTVKVSTPQDSLAVIGAGHSYRYLVPGILHSTPNKGIQWLIGGAFRHLVSALSLDREIGWRRHALAATQSFKHGDVDVVISSGGPWISHEIAGIVSKRLNCPYVLDYRDLWTGNPHTPVRWHCVTKRESTLYRNAAAIITIGSSMRAVQERLFGSHPNAVVISNGYDPIEYETISPAVFDGFSLVYAGQFEPPIRSIDPLFKVLRHLMESRTVTMPWSFHYYGRSTTYVQESARRHGVESKVQIHGSRTRREALSALKGSGVSLVVSSVAIKADDGEAGILTAKIFEAIGARVPFMVIAPQNADVHKVVDNTGGGRVFTSNEVRPMTQYIIDLMSGQRPLYRDPEAYAWSSLGKRLNDTISSLFPA